MHLVLLAVFACSGDGAGRRAGRAEGLVDTTALAQLGREGDDPLYQVADALFQGDTVIVAERSSGTLRFYRRSGELVNVAGGKGEGPGEFGRLSWIQEVNGSLFAYDGSPPRLSEFTAGGAFLRSVPIEPAEPFTSAFAVGVFSDQSILVDASRPRERNPAASVVRSARILLRYDAQGKYIDSLGSYEGSETYTEPFGRGGALSSPLVFGRRSGVAVAGINYYLVENNDYRIAVYDTAGNQGSRLASGRRTRARVRDGGGHQPCTRTFYP